MLVVLLIISVLLLLFVPNLAKEKKNIQNTGQTAVVKVVEGQAELYQLDKQDSPNLGKLVSDGLITQNKPIATMIIIPRTLMQNVMYRIKALTLLESLLVLFLCSSVLFLFSGSVKQSVRIARAEIFILQFERLYKDTQRMAGLKGQQTLSASNGTLYSHEEVLKVPEEVEINDFSITFDQKSGNSSLQKLQYFFLIRKTISYQLEIGSGKYKKKSLEAYLLLESLIAMSLLVFLSRLF